jgi:hypothetical protein
MKTTKQIAKIVSIDHLNKNFEVKITNCEAALEVGDNGSVLIPLPKSMFGEYFEVGDEIEFKKMDKPDFKIVNLSCEVLRLARFKRDLISILIRLNNDNHPQKRCVLLNEDGFVLLSAKKNPEKLILLQNKLDN